MMAPARLGAMIVLLTLGLDQASKLWLWFVVDIAATEPIRLAPFLDFVLVWNRGISYGLFQQDGDLGRWVLTIGSLVTAIVLAVFISRTSKPFVAAALGLIAGGALGNALDRLHWGAVLDFVHFHLGSFSWYIFNLADAAIVAGVVGLLYDSLVLERSRGLGAEGANKPDSAS